MKFYIDAGISHAELLLVTCLKMKTYWEIIISSCQCVIYRVICSLKYLRTMSQ
jgi:hypothetical protein